MMAKSVEKINDENARAKIKTELKKNFFVEASAGSGKTTILVERMVNMVKDEGFDISKICAITFTKAAANQFYGRFKKRLEAEAENGSAACNTALKNIDLCFMGTIDSFCQTILAEHPTEANVPVNSVIIDDNEESDFYKRFFNKIQAGEYGTDLQNRSFTFRKYNDKAENIFACMMKAFADRRNAEFEYQQNVRVISLDEKFQADKAKVQAVFQTLVNNAAEFKYEKDDKNRAAWDYLEKHFGAFDNKSWDDNISDVIYMLKSIGKLRLKPEADIDNLFGIYSSVFVSHPASGKVKWYEFSSSFDEIKKNIQNSVFSFCQSFVCDCLEIACEERKQQGKLTYFDYQLYLAKMLQIDAQNGGKLIKHIYERHSCFLLDEFQDTNPIQAEIFFYLAAETINEDWRKCIPHPGSLFIVGDPKQSIYRFRCADVTSYQNVKALFKGNVGEVVTLSCNFRSNLKLCEYFNTVFTQLMPEDTADQSKYPLIPLDEKADGDGCFDGIYSFVQGSNQPEPVLNIVKTLVGDPCYKIFDVEAYNKDQSEKVNKQIKYSDFMVITKGKRELGEYATAFSEAGIPFCVEGKAEFNKCPALVNLVKLYSAIANPNDRMKVVAALCTDVYRVDEAVIASYIHAKQSISLLECVEPTECSFFEELNELNQLVRKSYSTSPAAMFSVIMDETKLIEKSGVDRLEFLYFALELIREKTANGEIDSIGACSNYLEQLLVASGEERCLSFVQNQNCVHFANLHKVKGLEAPIVILAAGIKKNEDTSIRVDYTGNTPKCYCFAVTEKDANGQTKKLLENSQYTEQEEAEETSENAEYQRLLYVAATRAKNALIIGYEHNKDGSLVANTYWRSLLDKANDEQIKDFPFEGKSAEENPQAAGNENAAAVAEVSVSNDAQGGIKELFDAGKENAITNSTSKDETYKILLPSKIKLKSVTKTDDLAENDMAEAAEPEASEAESTTESRKKGLNSALIGTIVHRLMELLVTTKNQIGLDVLIADICFDYGLTDKPAYKQILEEVGNKITNGGYVQENGGAADILSVLLDADEVFCELPFCRQIDGEAQIWHGVIDVVYCKDGIWHIVDYKTNDEENDLDIVYQEQLSAYIAAFRELTGNVADAKIYHIDV